MALNLKLALDRVLKDYADGRAFVKLPYELLLIKQINASWIKQLEDRVISGDYSPSAMEICEIPKSNYHIRPGAHLLVEDAVYYTALVGEAYDSIHKSTVWARDRYDFSYALTGDKEKVKWVSDSFNEWKHFRIKSLDKIKQGYNCVLVADISAFYENINIQTLSYDLKHVGVSTQIADAISNCLNTWAQNHGKGIPQGYTPSNILAKVYLNTLDERLINDGFIYYRYVDDIRIFCKSETEAKQALIVLTSLLRSRGLNLQTSKTKILFDKDANNYIEGVQPIIEGILSEIKEAEESEKLYKEIIQALELAVVSSDPYNESIFNEETIESEFEIVEAENKDAVVLQSIPSVNHTQSDEIFSNSNPETVDISIIKRTFDFFFIKSKSGHFDKTLFRFLLKRLAKAKDDFAVDYCKQLFEKHPEETATLLKYFKDVETSEDLLNTVGEFLLSSNAIYHYQTYQIIEWLDINSSVNIKEDVVAMVRKLSFDNSIPYYLKSISRKYFSNFVRFSDLETFERICKETKDPIEQAELICFLQKMEKNRRNATYSRLEKKNLLNKAAIAYAKSLDAVATL